MMENATVHNITHSPCTTCTTHPSLLTHSIRQDARTEYVPTSVGLNVLTPKNVTTREFQYIMGHASGSALYNTNWYK